MLTDAELVASARAGDRGALSEIYDTYADRLYDLCTSVLRDHEAAFDAMVDTFVLAALELYRLRRPDKLEPWLFALARQQLLEHDIPIGIDEHAEFNGATGSATSDGAGAIVWEAASWFPGKDRILLDLHARQPLDNRALAETLGVSPSHADALVRDLDEKMGRRLSALLVARLARPDCEHMKKLIANENDSHPDTWLRRVAMHVDVCRTCVRGREDQPNPIRLIAEVPAEPAPPEVRDEVLDRVDLLWSVLGPPEWTAAVLGQPPVDLPPDPLLDTDGTDETGPSGETQENLVDDDTEPVPIESIATVSQAELAEQEYDAYDEVESLVPPPPRLRRNGFPRSMYPGRRRWVRAAVVVSAAVFAAAIFANFRGFGSPTRYFAAESGAAASQEQPPVTTAPPTTAPPTTAPVGPDTAAPIVFNLDTVFGCIGPRQSTTPAIASVVDPGGNLASVELVFVDASGAEQRRRMTANGGAFQAPIGPYTVDGTLTWQVVATDEAGNATTSEEGQAPAVAGSSSC
jgi:DNA-directed RNA polymerase specialized sigma24 family protein